MKYFYSGKGLGLGNFINCTPFLKALSYKWQQPIKVYSENVLINFCYQDCDFLEFIHERPKEPFFAHTRMYIEQKTKHRKYIMSDAEYFFNVIGKRFGLSGSIPPTYIDTPKTTKKGGIAFINGAGAWSKEYLDKKIIDSETVKSVRNQVQGHTYTLGAIKDLYCYTDEDYRGLPIREQLALLNKAEYVVSNEGGLAHAAAAMNKPLFIMWKSTDKVKNKNLSKNTFYSYKDHADNMKDFIILHQK